MKKLLLLSLLSIFLFSCSSDDKENESYLVYVNKTNVICLDEIVEMNLFYYENNNQPITSLSQAKQVVEQANKEALENYESGKISCQYKYIYLKIEDGTALPKP